MSQAIELIAPAGDFEKLKTAVHFGADAVYLGGDAFSLRARANNFSGAALNEAVKYAHSRNVKAYIAVNVLARNSDFADLPAYLDYIKKIKADAVIVSDVGVFALAKRAGLNIHISTQANVTNAQAAKFWRDQGASRVILARELTLREIKEIHDNMPNLELEAFCHGAMCVSYSGRCLLSDYMTGRSGNRGECAQPCRYNYALTEERRPGEHFPIEETETGAYILSPKDLRTVEFLPDMMNAGITSFKIEGRMKTEFYAACAVKAYRAAFSDLTTQEAFVNGEYVGTKGYRKHTPRYIELLDMPSNREFHSGFYFGKPDGSAYRHEEGGYVRRYEFTGVVEDIVKGKLDGDFMMDIRAKVRVKGKIALGDTAVWVTAEGENISHPIEALYNEEMEPIEKATIAGSAVFTPAPPDVRTLDILARPV